MIFTEHSVSPEHYEPNYNISETDISSTLFFTNEQLNKLYNSNTRLFKVALHLMGMDVSRPIELVVLGEGMEFVSPLTSLRQLNGQVYNGYERTDKDWVKGGKERMVKWLYEDPQALLDMLLKGKE